MAPAIIAAIISAAASKVKSNQASAQKMNEGNKTGGTYQIGGGNSNGAGVSYQPTSQSTNSVGTGGGDLAKNIIKEYLEKKNNGAETTTEVASDAANEAASETANEVATETAENVAENIH